jgi:hypothetical protein
MPGEKKGDEKKKADAEKVEARQPGQEKEPRTGGVDGEGHPSGTACSGSGQPSTSKRIIDDLSSDDGTAQHEKKHRTSEERRADDGHHQHKRSNDEARTAEDEARKRKRSLTKMGAVGGAEDAAKLARAGPGDKDAFVGEAESGSAGSFRLPDGTNAGGAGGIVSSLVDTVKNYLPGNWGSSSVEKPSTGTKDGPAKSSHERSVHPHTLGIYTVSQAYFALHKT